jgi:hypothetical protein
MGKNGALHVPIWYPTTLFDLSKNSSSFDKDAHYQLFDLIYIWMKLLGLG